MEYEILCSLIFIAFAQYGYSQSLTVSPGRLKQCPVVTVTCSADNLPSTVLRWFLDEDTITVYTLRNNDNYPLSVPPENSTLSAIVGGVDIQILAARNSDDNRDVASFLSTMTANFSALQMAHISEISCGTFELKTAFEVTYNPNNVPSMPTNITIQLEYDTDLNLKVIQVSWNEVLSRNEYCYYSVNYTVSLEDNESNVVMPLLVVGSDICENSVCSTSLIPPPTNRSYYYRIGIVAFNSVGTSNYTLSDALVYDSIGSFFNHTVSFDNCKTTIGCYSIIAGIENCTIQYNQFLADVDASSPRTISLNSSIELAPMESSTPYYLKITFTLDSMFVTLNSSFITSSGDNGTERYTSTNIILLGIGLPLLFITSMMLILTCFLVLLKKVYMVLLSYVVLFVLSMDFAIPLVIWIVAFAVIERQTDLCVSSWITRKDNLIISAFSLSIFSCTLSVTVLLLAVKFYNKTFNSYTIESGGRKNCMSPVIEMEHQSADKVELQSPKEETKLDSGKCVFCHLSAKNSCKGCKKLICSKCSKDTAYFEDKDVILRVCDTCFKMCKSEYVLYEDHVAKDGVYFYRELWIEFSYYKKALNFDGNTRLINFTEVSWVGNAKNRPSVLNCLEIKFIDGKCYIISFCSSKTRDEWCSILRDAVASSNIIEIGNNDTHSTGQESLCVCFAETVETTFLDDKQWKEVFMIWTKTSIEVYDTVEEQKPSISVKLEKFKQANLQKTSYEDDEIIEVKGKTKSFQIKPLHHGQFILNTELVNLFQELLDGAVPRVIPD